MLHTTQTWLVQPGTHVTVQEKLIVKQNTAGQNVEGDSIQCYKASMKTIHMDYLTI